MSYHKVSTPVRVGIVGTGWVARERHIPAFKRDSRCTITTLFDPDYSRAELTARKFRIPRFVNRLDDFLKEPVDVVSICAPPGAHASLIEASIRAGKHVLVEKPMTLTSEEGKSLKILASEAGLLLCPVHNFLFSRSMRRAKSLLEAGKVGEVSWVMGVQLNSWRRRLPTWFNELPGGLFFDEAPHFLYLMRYFLGELSVEEVWHHASETDSLPDERMEVRLYGTRGSGQLTMWTGSPFSEWLFILFCSHAVLVLDLFRDILIHLPPERAHKAQDVLKFSVRGTLQLWREIGTAGLHFIGNRLLYGHDHLVRQFLEAVVTGGESPVTAQDGFEVVALIEEILNRTAGKA